MRHIDAAFLRAMREDARAAQHSRCAYCRAPLTAATATADHIVARHNGGNDRAGNIAAACGPCNRAKGHATVGEFRNRIKSPRPGAPLSIWFAWSRRRVNLRIERMEKRLYACVGIARP